MGKAIGILCMIILFLLPLSFAASLEVDDIRGFVNNERASDVDENGGDFDVESGDVIDLIVSLKNLENQTVQAKLKGTLENIDDGDDIVKEQDFYDIVDGDTRAKTLSFPIPSDTRNDIYDLKLVMFFKNSSGTEGTVDEARYDVIVKKGATDEKQEVDINGVILNLTASCNSLASSTNTCFGYIEKSGDCSSELSTVKEERGTFKQQSEDCSTSVGVIKGEKSELESQKTVLESQIQSMITHTQCSNQTNFAIASVKRENDKKLNNTLIMVGGAILAYWYYNKKKKEKASVVSSYESDYYEKA